MISVNIKSPVMNELSKKTKKVSNEVWTPSMQVLRKVNDGALTRVRRAIALGIIPPGV